MSVDQTTLDDLPGCGPVIDYDLALKAAYEQLLPEDRHPTLAECPGCGAHLDLLDEPARYDCPQCEWREPI